MNQRFIAHRRKKDGKAQGLWRHLEETSGLAGAFAAKIGLRNHGRLLGLLHDLGKASEEFDNYIRSAVGLIDPDEDNYVDASRKKGQVDHSSAGAQTIQEQLSKLGSESAITAQFLSLCIASHHSGMIDCLSPQGDNNYKLRMAKEEAKTHTREAFANLSDSERQIVESLFTEKLTAQLVAKLQSLKEEENDSQESLMFKYGLLARSLFSCLIDADRLNTADFETPQNSQIRNYGDYIKWHVLIERFDAKKFEKKNQVDELRETISRQCFEYSGKPKGLYQLTVPTGGGKTFSSLRFALNHAARHDMDRIVYVIPYTSIIDQNADEVRRILQQKGDKGRLSERIVLEHHSNLTPDKETHRQSLLSENWDAPIVFTTSVQFMETMFGFGTRSARRMHQLANAVIIFDEVQTIPIRCVHMFNVALRFLIKACESTIVLCTATQPLLDNIEIKERALQILPEQRMIQDVRRLFQDLKRVEVHDLRRPGGWSEDEVVEIAHQELRELETLQENASALIVVNTKASAKRLYHQFIISHPGATFHLSTDMCPQHRLDVLSTIKDRLKEHLPTICVSTQLIEAGVDVDFGSVIRYLAGLDSIAQAAGRCNRHGFRRRGNVFIVNPKVESLDHLEEMRIAAETTQRVLDEFKKSPMQFNNDILSPAAMEQFYKYYFYDRRDRMNYPITSKSPVGREDNLFSLLSTNPLSVMEYERINGEPPALFLRQSFQTASRAFKAIDSPTRGVVVSYGREGRQIINDLYATHQIEKQYQLLKKAQRYSVNVYESVFRDLANKGIIMEVHSGTGVFSLDDRYYSNEIGLSREIVNEMEVLITRR